MSSAHFFILILAAFVAGGAALFVYARLQPREKYLQNRFQWNGRARDAE